MTRAMSLDHPIGDPTGGPAYGERRDPVTAIMAVASMWEAGTVIAGAATLMAGFEALTIAQGLAFVGGALTLIGTATDNNDLMLLGSVVGLAGAVGGSMSDPGSGFDQTFSEAFTPKVSLTEAPAAAGNGLYGPQTTVGNQAAGTVTTPDLVSATPSGDTVAGGIKTGPYGQQPVTTNLNAPKLDPLQAGTNFDPLSNLPNPTAASGAGMKAPGSVSASNTTNLTGAPPAKTGIINDAMAFAKENPMAAMVLGQAASGVATGVMDMASGKSAAQTEQLKADASYRNSVADKTNRDSALQASRIAQMNANLKAQLNAGQVKVNPGAVTFNAQPPGLIAGARA